MAYILQCIRLVSHTVESVKLIIYNYNSKQIIFPYIFIKRNTFFSFLLVSYLRLSQQEDDTFVGWLNHFIGKPLSQQLHPAYLYDTAKNSSCLNWIKVTREEIKIEKEIKNPECVFTIWLPKMIQQFFWTKNSFKWLSISFIQDTTDNFHRRTNQLFGIDLKTDLDVHFYKTNKF